MENSITIREYKPEDKRHFENLNRDWIEKFFVMEPLDKMVLQNPEEHLLKPGGKIFMAEYNGKVAGTVALKFVRPGIYEFTKMAVDEKFRGLKIGKELSWAAISKAKSIGADAIILYSNTILIEAISLYRNLGFKEVPLDGPYKRSNIKMELTLQSSMTAKVINDLMLKHLEQLRHEISSYQHEEKLWYIENSIANSAGNLCLHLIGNLNTYIGVAIGKTNYIRNRDLEFSDKGVPKEKLVAAINNTMEVVTKSLQNVQESQLDEVFPMEVFKSPVSTRYMLIHLTAHLTYHLGQVNYHRRLLDHP